MDFTSYYISLVPIIIFIIEIAVQIGLPKKLAPLISLVVGILVSTVYLSPDNIYKGIIIGILLSSCCVGFYSGIKNIFQYFSKVNKFYNREE